MGFKPEKAQIAPQQKPKIALPPPSTDQEMYDKYGIDLGDEDYYGPGGTAMATASPVPSNPATSVIDSLIVNPFNSLKGAILGLGG